MTKIEQSIDINAPLDKVYAFASDWRNLQRYFVYVQDVKPTTEKTLGEGAQLALKVRFLGRTMDADWKGTEHEPNVGWGFDATLMGVTAAKRWRFAPMSDSTRVTFTLEYKPSPPVVGDIANVLLIAPQWRKVYRQSFQELKRLMEAEAGTAPKGSQE